VRKRNDDDDDYDGPAAAGGARKLQPNWLLIGAIWNQNYARLVVLAPSSLAPSLHTSFSLLGDTRGGAGVKCLLAPANCLWRDPLYTLHWTDDDETYAEYGIKRLVARHRSCLPAKPGESRFESLQRDDQANQLFTVMASIIQRSFATATLSKMKDFLEDSENAYYSHDIFGTVIFHQGYKTDSSTVR